MRSSTKHSNIPIYFDLKIDFYFEHSQILQCVINVFNTKKKILIIMLKIKYLKL